MTDLRALREAVYPRRAPLEIGARHLHGEPVAPGVAMAGDFVPFAVGDAWGGMWDTTWFRLRGTIPADWAGEEVVLLVHLGGDDMVGFSAEGLVFDRTGTAMQGLHHKHRSVLLAAPATGGEGVEIYVEAAANPIPRWHKKDWPLLAPDYNGPPLYVLEQTELATVDRVAEARYLDERLARQIAECAERAQHDHVVTAVGHAHIDSAWLWPVRETRRKCARTFANQLRLMELYPEHRFVCSQAAQYEWVRDGYPDLYRQIRERIAEGRWEPVGGMWVEPDSNIPSGESLVRQLVFGKRYFLDEFGVESHELWIPDVFGYSAALPQIAAQAGVTALVTQKMSWNDTNKFPHSTFWWEGHDGSRLLAHFPPANTYNGDFSVRELVASSRLESSLYPFGFGDGGGGPTATMLEQARRAAKAEELPRVELGRVDEFLEDLAGGDLPTWVGELYLEYHRGTYTTHADVKLANRRAEEELRAAEMWTVAAGLPADLDRAWKLLLFNQFHDIIPGSGIHWVYDDAARDHAEVLAKAGRVKAEAQAALAGGGGGLVAFNPSSYARREVVDLPGGERRTISLPGCGWAPVDDPAPAKAPIDAPVEVGDGWIDNGVLRVRWDGDGLLTSVWDHADRREVLSGRGNLFQLHEDHPKAFDAWEVDRDYLDQVTDLTAVDDIEVVERHPLRAGVRIRRSFGGSSIDQVMRLSAGSRRLEFHTTARWWEEHKFLKVAFPVEVRSARATYEIQHGYVERPTVANTSWDEARFEVCAHRWADLSEAGYGVALLNDCKYGYDIRSNVMRLSLLRAPGYPDPEADRGEHRFAYALLPHGGDLRDVIEEAERFNLPVEVRPGAGAGQIVAVDRRGVSIEAVKWADRDSGVVVRICEVWGSRGPVRVTLNRPFGGVSRTDLLERDLCEVGHDGQSAVVDLRPFELVTLRFAERDA